MSDAQEKPIPAPPWLAKYFAIQDELRKADARAVQRLFESFFQPEADTPVVTE